MFVKKLKDCKEFIAGDGTSLREILHPFKENLKFRYSLAYAQLNAGGKSKPHRLKTSEVYYILQGRGIMHIDDKKMHVMKTDTVYIKPGRVQYIENAGNSDLRFLCIVDPAWRVEDEEVFIKDKSKIK